MEHPPLKSLVLKLMNSTQAIQHMLVTELNDTERTALGTPVHWSARVHVAHLTFWKQDLSLTLDALARSETPPSKEHTQALNERVFEVQREQPWDRILLEAQQAHVGLLVSVERLTEDDFVHVDWFAPVDGDDHTSSVGQPLWALILSNGFWHLLEHFTQFYLERNDVPRATYIQQAWAELVVREDVPSAIRSISLATLARFYLITKRPASAQEPLRQALALDPSLAKLFLSHPDVPSLLAE